MDPFRRGFIKLAARAGAWAMTAASGLLQVTLALAANWNKPAFEAKAVPDVLKTVGGTNSVESKDILIAAPDVAENGAAVRVTVTSRIPNTRSIAILVEKNPFPLVAIFDLANDAEGYVSTQLKMGQTSHVRAVVKADARVYTAAKEVKVTVGGCG